MSSATKGPDGTRLVSLSDEEAVKDILAGTVLDLWKVVNNLSRPGRRSASAIVWRFYRRAPSPAPSSMTR